MVEMLLSPVLCFRGVLQDFLILAAPTIASGSGTKLLSPKCCLKVLFFVRNFKWITANLERFWEGSCTIAFENRTSLF